MEQTPFVEISEFDWSTIDLSKPAHTAEEYLKQGIVIRESIPKVVKAELNENIIEKVDIPLFRLGNDLPKFNFIPPCRWISAQLRMFMSQRIKYLTFCKDDKITEFHEIIAFPKEIKDWIYFCTGEKDDNSDVNEISQLKSINPSPSILKNMDTKDKNSCLYSLTEYLQSTDKPVEKAFLWIYCLLLSLALPLSPNTTSTLRILSKRCHHLRSKLTPCTDRKLISIYSMFIAIIGNCYSQKDLTDYKLQ
uniref:Gem-associated protein 2 n=1 Tax=Strongyloides stercoralis TaxID=6248 RepID=A0A0K0EHP7_STRER